MRPNEKVFWISVIANFVWPDLQIFALENHKWINPYHDVVSFAKQNMRTLISVITIIFNGKKQYRIQKEIETPC